MVQIVLLLSLFFNIAHAFVIVSQEQCVHESPIEYVMEQSHSNDCGDVCDLHHFFHWSAIIMKIESLDTISSWQQLYTYKNLHFITLSTNTIKPPIS